MSKNQIKKILTINKNKIRKSKILCIGDIILDHYIFGKVHRLSPEAPVPILLSERESYKLGGVGNVVKNISSIGAKASILYLSGNNNSSKIIKNLIKKEKDIKRYQITVPNFITPVKIRYINKTAQIMRLDRENLKFKLNKSYIKIIVNRVDKIIKNYDLIVLSDYNKGIFDKSLIKSLVILSKKYNKKIIVDPKNIDLSIYANVDLITPNQKEITDSAFKKYLSEKNLIKYSKKIINNHKIKNILITRSKDGMLFIDDKKSKKYLANANKVIDVTGAGDTVLALLAVMLSAGCTLNECVIVSNYAAGLVIAKNGTESLTFKELMSWKKYSS